MNLKNDINNAVTIVGAGPAGIALAQCLLTSDIAVNLVCGGARGNSQSLEELYLESNLIPKHHESLLENRVRGPGGTSERWGGRLVELSESDFGKTNADIGGSWPITKPDLESYYEKSLKFFGIEENRNSLILGEVVSSKILADLIDANFSDAPLLEKLDLGTPEIWTEIGNVYSNKIRQLQGSPNFQLYEDWHVVGLNLRETLTDIDSVVIANLDGERRNLDSKIVVLACGAIENSRQLLLLKEKYPFLGENSLQFVGRGYTSHIFIHLKEILKPEEFFWNFRGIRHGLLRNRFRFDFNHDGIVINAAGFFAYPPLQGSGIHLSRVLNFVKKYRFRIFTSREIAIRSLKMFLSLRNQKRKDNEEIDPNERQCLHLQLEKIANMESRITLGQKVDVFGNRLPQARLHFSEVEKSAHRAIIDSIVELFPKFEINRSLLSSNIEDQYKLPNSNAHQIGGTVMGSSRHDSVVDLNLRVHEFSNLYVLGSSTFTTSGEANPTHTIVALAIRLGDFIARERT